MLSVTYTHTHTQMQKHPGTCFWERGGESVWQVKEAPWCSSLLLLLCVCVWLRTTEDCIHYAEWDVYKTPFSHTSKHENTHIFPSARCLGLRGRIAALLSRIHLFYLGWQSCLINWILNKPSQKTSPHNFFYLPVHVRVRERARVGIISIHRFFFALWLCECVRAFFLCISNFNSTFFLILSHKYFLRLSIISVGRFFVLFFVFFCLCLWLWCVLW